MKIEGKMMQFMTGSKAEATEEGAEMQEDDVATLELKSRHQEQPVQPPAAEADVATRRLMSRHHNQQQKGTEGLS